MQTYGCHFVLQSLNGIAVNGKKLKALEPYTLQDGDTVQLGVPTSPDASSEFVYRFFASLKVRKEPRRKHKRPCSEDGSPAKRFKGSGKPDESGKPHDESGEPDQGAEGYAVSLTQSNDRFTFSKMRNFMFEKNARKLFLYFNYIIVINNLITQ